MPARGAGFDPDRARAKGGLGLINMQERVRLLNGDFSVTSRAGRGTRLLVRIPLPEGAAQAT